MTEILIPSAKPAPSRPRRLLRRLWRWTISLLALIGFLSLVRPFLFDFTPLASGSMSPTLQGDEHSGDWVLAEKITYRFRNPRRWEVVEFHDAEGLQIMKRVVALPGETIAIEDHHLLVNGQPADPPPGTARVPYYPYGNLNGGTAHPAGAGYFLLGDDSADSQDSRYEGSVTLPRIQARALLILWPPNRIGWVR